MKRLCRLILFLGTIVFITGPSGDAQATKVSKNTEACLACHAILHPGIVADWKRSRHAAVSPSEGLKKPLLQRRISNEKVPGAYSETVVGCAECHTMTPERHRDSFDHNGFKVHVVVSPDNCATCHSVEAVQYQKNLMSHAHTNLVDNTLYQGLIETINGISIFENGNIILKKESRETDFDSCLHCHGTRIETRGLKTRETVMGKMDFPVLNGWPNQGVGRVNPDGSKGSCTACHTRHQFSIEMARKPHTCSQCHKGPDVPAYKVYEVSKHGNLYASLGKEWNFNHVPWVVGRDFTAPTCATCHVSLTVTEAGETVSERTHQMSDRAAWRIFGLIYAHPHPLSPDTTVIKNKAGLPLPTELSGEPATNFLIDSTEQKKRRHAMQKVCFSCHSQGWVSGQWARFEHTINTSNEMTLAATRILLTAWEEGSARGLGKKESIFDEALEKRWVEQWLFYANSTRFASAMMGADYGVFANGRWSMSKNIQEMLDWLEFKRRGLQGTGDSNQEKSNKYKGIK